MKQLLTILVFFASFGSFLSACATPTVQPTLTPTRDATKEYVSTHNAEIHSTSTAAVATEQFQSTSRAARESTAHANETQIATTATAQAGIMSDVITDLFEKGVIKHPEGKYYRLDDFDESWAQINWYTWFPTRYSPSNFVIRADIEYDAASSVTNWFDSGCGFVFRAEDENNHYSAFINMDGWVTMLRVVNNNYRLLADDYAEKLDVPHGTVTLMLVMEKNHILAYVNGKKVTETWDSALTEGYLGYALASGTNAGFGTRCAMTNIDLWILTED